MSFYNDWFLKLQDLGLIVRDPSSIIYYSQCRYCEKSEQTLQLLSSQELWKDYESNMNHYTLKLSASLGTRSRFNFTLIEGSSSLYRPTTGVLTPFLAFLKQDLNFTYILRPTATPGIEFPNGSWTGLVHKVMKGELDIAICVAETFRRHSVAEFSPVIFYEAIALTTGYPQKIYVWYAIFWPLSPEVWTVVWLSSGLSVLVIFFLVKSHRMKSIKTEEMTDPTPPPLTWSIGRIVEYILQSFVGQFDALPPGDQEIPTSIRFFLIWWLFFSFLVSTFYLSMLVGFLTFPVLEKIPESGEELAANPNFKVGITYIGGALISVLRGSKAPTIVNLVGRMELNDALTCIRSTITEKKVCIGYVSLTNSFINKEGLLSSEGKRQKPPVQIHQQALFSLRCGVLVSKRSVLAPNIAGTVRAAISAGLVAEWERQDYRKLRLQTLLKAQSSVDDKDKTEASQEEEDDMMTLKNLKGAFLILAGGLSISSVCLIGETLWGVRNKLRFNFYTIKTMAVSLNWP
jgi:hypothetical protein